MTELERLPIPLLAWYRENARVLPWRSAPTAYHVWVSEIMLQQTRVAAVMDYYRRFLEVLPTVEELARCDEDRLMKLWQGLGYYSRARNLQRSARQIMDEHGGKFPADYAAIRALPGVGDYTAGAIASIAFCQPVPAVDGNVLRVVTRLTADSRDVTRPATKRDITAALEAVMPLQSPGDFNQALMELGATVCLPNGAPLCESCPARAFCAAHRDQRETDFPVKPPKRGGGWRDGRCGSSSAGDGWPCAAGRKRACWPGCGSIPTTCCFPGRSPAVPWRGRGPSWPPVSIFLPT